MKTLDHRSVYWAVSLSMIAGYVDAHGFLQLGGYFVSFMSGNTTRLGLSLSSQVAGNAVVSLGIIFLFICGVVFGSLVASKVGDRRRPVIFALVAALLSTSALCYMAGQHSFGAASMIFAMGLENTILRRDGVNIGLTYMTGNLVRMGHSIADALQGGPRWDWTKYLILWLALALGATLGALAHHVYKMNGLWFAALAAAGFAVASGQALAKPAYEEQ